MAYIDINRFFVETAVSKGLHDIRRDPNRSLRNLVDLAQNFSNSWFQKSFLHTIQTMLRRRDSPYYALVRRVTAAVHTETLKTFGVNLGYNSLTRGAGTIRTLEAERGFAIPWTISLAYSGAPGGMTVSDIDRVVAQGKQLGIYTYLLFLSGGTVPQMAPLLGAHKDCAFVLFLAPGGHSPEDIDLLAAHRNHMAAVATADADFAALTRRLEENLCLYAAYAYYTGETVQALVDSAWIESIVPSGCAFAFLMAGEGCPEPVRRQVNAYVTEARMRQRYPIVLMDFDADMRYIGETVSKQACSLYVDSEGRAYPHDAPACIEEDIRRGTLLSLLGRTMPHTPAAK